jgi:branched-subunit amino acid transport protein
MHGGGRPHLPAGATPVSIWVLLVVAAVVTYASRVVTTALLPAPEGRLAELIERLPAPLFGALAAVALVDSASGPGDWPVLAAVLGALAASRTRSLFMVLAAGLAAYGLTGWITGF